MTETEGGTHHLDPVEDFEGFVASTAVGYQRAAYRETGNVHDAEDVVQNVLEKLFRTRESVAARGDALTAYGYKAIHWAAVDHHRRNGGRQSKVVTALKLYSEDEATDGGIPDYRASALGERIVELIGGLPPQQRTAVTLRYLEEMEIEEVARSMELGEETVKRYLRAALKGLEKMIRNTGKEVTV
ncbi:RNA polymerase sigma24 factor [Kitasatospora phosalacinea]|uniref:RNA polymerase sigma24 factor n=1 Tax=Kitasatospora phosalacinea TaxID=2065 RepID=A0A9W6QIH6_9ACTN|nr:RNA polymerase sigma factor [Kitasatospora phosalacinea]GLW75443.1 RNA polymerase sigma24 factor [Kitasatospora phosalacinea]